MRLIIAGSRTLGRDALEEALEQHAIHGVSEVVCGGARGIDEAGALWADERGIPVRLFPAHWDKWGRKAGPIRNRRMAENADALLLVWDGKSPGSKNMRDEAVRANLLVKVWLVKG